MWVGAKTLTTWKCRRYQIQCFDLGRFFAGVAHTNANIISYTIQHRTALYAQVLPQGIKQHCEDSWNPTRQFPSRMVSSQVPVPKTPFKAQRAPFYPQICSLPEIRSYPWPPPPHLHSRLRSLSRFHPSLLFLPLVPHPLPSYPTPWLQLHSPIP